MSEDFKPFFYVVDTLNNLTVVHSNVRYILQIQSWFYSYPFIHAVLVYFWLCQYILGSGLKRGDPEFIFLKGEGGCVCVLQK